MTDPRQVDAQEMARRFNEDEAIWRLYQQKRLSVLLLLRRLGRSTEDLERLAWAEAEAEVRPTRCIGVELP